MVKSTHYYVTVYDANVYMYMIIVSEHPHSKNEMLHCYWPE